MTDLHACTRARCDRSLLTWAIALAAMLVVADARAEECTPETRRAHRLSLGAGYSGVCFNGGTDGYYYVEGQRPSGHLGYAYSPERGLEVGADLVIFSGPIFLPAGMIRGYVPIGARDI